jgi:glucokinase
VDDAHALGIDIGGTQLRTALIDRQGVVLNRERYPTPADDPDRLLAALERVLSRLPASLPVGIGIAGLVTPTGTVRYGPNIGVRELPLAAELHQRTGHHVVVANDASVAAFGEQRVGAGAGAQDVLLVTIGTGVGGGVVLGGQLVLGTNGFAGEIGHVVVARDGRRCPCGNHGCVEAYASGTAIGTIAQERLAAGGDSVLRDAEDLAGPDVSRAAAAGDELARAVLTDAGGWLGVALASLVNVLDPQLVLIGGGAADAVAPWLLPAADAQMRELLLGATHRTPPSVELAALGDDAGVVGAALLAADGIAPGANSILTPDRTDVPDPTDQG